MPVGWRPPSGGSVTTDVNCCLPNWQATGNPDHRLTNMERKGQSLSHGPLLGHSGGSQTRPKTDLVREEPRGAASRQLLEAPRRLRQAVNSENFDVDQRCWVTIKGRNLAV